MELERTVLAETADPLHLELRVVIASDDFYDYRHARIFSAVKVGNTELLSVGDRHYLDGAKRYAFPVVLGSIETFFDLGARRRRLFELEAERAELLGAF